MKYIKLQLPLPQRQKND